MRRKAEILGLLLDEQSHTAPEVAAVLGIGLSNASELLRRYHGQGLVRRRRRQRCFPPNPYAYQITDKGVERYEWLTGPGEREVAPPGARLLWTPARRPPDFYHGGPEGRHRYPPYREYGKPGWLGTPEEDGSRTEVLRALQERWEGRLRPPEAKPEDHLPDTRQEPAGKGGRESAITIPDARGKPMVVPYDPALMDALRRQREAKARKAEWEAMMTEMAALHPGRQVTSLRELLEPLAKRLRDEVKAAAESATEAREMLHRMEMEALTRSVEQASGEARRARELAVAFQGKRLAEYLQVAGSELKEALQRAGQDIKGGIQDFGDRMTSILATQQVPPRQERLRSLLEIVAIMEAEDRFLEAVHSAGKGEGKRSASEATPVKQPVFNTPTWNCLTTYWREAHSHSQGGAGVRTDCRRLNTARTWAHPPLLVDASK